MTTTVQVIDQGRLLEALGAPDHALVRAKLLSRGQRNTSRVEIVEAGDLDPDGRALVQMQIIHNDGEELRVLALFKLKGDEEPHEGKLTMPFGLATSLIRDMEVES